MHKSGNNDLNILSTTCYQYKVTNGNKAFSHQKARDVCRKDPKWVLNPKTAHSDSTTGSNKRRRTFKSDMGFGLDLNDDYNDTEAEDPPEVQLC